MQNFSGSYRPDDVTFLLKPVSIEETAVEEKERAIQSGTKHYSEMLSAEKTPGERYMSLFYRALEMNMNQFAADLGRLALTLARRPGKEVVLTSLARAGTPVGVLLHRALKHLGRDSIHYSVSIIRDRGIDAVALDCIRQRHADQDLVFVDGWTGKGAITTELKRSLAEYNQSRGASLIAELVVISDLAGVAGTAASPEDYLIPSAILNSIVSGLVSRTVLNDLYVGDGDFHACMFYADKLGEDLSQFFVDAVTPHMVRWMDEHPDALCVWGDTERDSLKRASDAFIAGAMQRWQVSDRNRVKPGVGESTRALLRRVPDRLIVNERDSLTVEHLIALAEANGVPIEVDADLPYKAAVIIKTLGD